MKEPTVVITFDEDGSATVDAVGFTGKKCKDATRAYELALGAVALDTAKPELHQVERQHTGGGGGM